MAVDLAIIIVSYNDRPDLERCLQSLHRPAPALTHRIVVVDNGSTDGSPAAVRDDWPAVVVVENGENTGFARATNVGIRASESDLVLLLNPDTIVPPGALDALVADLRAHPEAAVCGPRLIDGDGRPEISFGPMIGPLHEVRQKLIGRLYGWRVPPIVGFVDRQVRKARYPDWVSGACLLARREDLEEVGLLDERFFLYTEDVDLCASVRARGRLVRFTPAAEVIHLRGRSVRRDRTAAEQAYLQSRIAFYAKHHPRWTGWLRAYLRVTGRLH
jgi:N-acetylglucosaminyl-diphospho-decaprenol L-rhamnosyltransferase